MTTRIIVVLASLVLAAMLAAFWVWSGGVAPKFAGRSSINPEVFADGIGIYVFNDAKYSILVWKKKLVVPGAAPDEKDISEALRQAVPVKRDVRFFSYGLDFSKWPSVPPYVMAFCIARDAKTIDGIFPIRLKPVDHNQSAIYELILPPVIDSLRSGAMKHLFWAINFQHSCNDGWVFKFQ